MAMDLPPEAEEKSEEELMAEWEAMEDDDGETERLLNQNEIDNLMGFEGAEGESKKGLSLLIDSALVSYERLPMLEVVFDRLVRLLSTSLRNFTSDNVEVTLENMTSIRFGDYLNSIPLPAMINVIQAEEWDTSSLLTVESPLIYSMVDVLLGGKRSTETVRAEGRPYTTIERNLIEEYVKVILTDLTLSFEPIAPVKFSFDRLETNPRFATIVRPNNACILCRVRVEMDDRGGYMEFVIPYSSLEPVREQLLQMFVGEKFGQDSIWETHLAGEVMSTNIIADAVLDRVSVNLKDILTWEKGSQLMLEVAEDDPVGLYCGENRLITGKVGKKRQRVSIQVEANHIKEEDE